MDTDEERRARAEARRRGYPGKIVPAGSPKPRLYDDLDPLERLAHLTALSQRQAALSGTAEQPLPRSQWPGEIFRIKNKRAAARPKDLADVAWLEDHPDEKDD